MDYKQAIISCIERIDNEIILKRLYSIIKKADKKSRFAPKSDAVRDPLPDDISSQLCTAVRERKAR